MNMTKRSLNNIILIAFISLVSFSSRINVGTLNFQKRLDIRGEDILLVLLVGLFWPLSLKGSRLKKPIFAYFSLAFLSTFFGIFVGWLEPVRAFCFLGKELEYISAFMIVRKIAKEEKSVKIALTAFLVCAFINGGYVIAQLASGQIGRMPELFTIGRIQYYGVRIFGEYTPTTVGAYFTLVIIVSMSVLVFISTRRLRLLSFMCIWLGIIGLIGSFSRSSIFGALISMAVFGPLCLFGGAKTRMRIKIAILYIALGAAAYGVLIYYSKRTDATFRLTRIENIQEKYRSERQEDIYSYYFPLIRVSPLIGFGKSITGGKVEQVQLPSETHNYFLRIFIEMGSIGLGIFLYLMYRIFVAAFQDYRYSYSSINKVVALTCIVYTVALLATSIAQDAFTSVKTSENYWIFLGLMEGRRRWKDMSA